jgi:homoserine dehydrogenase
LEETPFSVTVSRAVEKEYTETDFRDDITGKNMAKKVVILARQLGLDVELADVEVESLRPDDIAKKCTNAAKRGSKWGSSRRSRL